MKLDFSRAALIEAAIHLAILGVCASLSARQLPEVWSDVPEQVDSVRIA